VVGGCRRREDLPPARAGESGRASMTLPRSRPGCVHQTPGWWRPSGRTHSSPGSSGTRTTQCSPCASVRRAVWSGSKRYRALRQRPGHHPLGGHRRTERGGHACRQRRGAAQRDGRAPSPPMGASASPPFPGFGFGAGVRVPSGLDRRAAHHRLTWPAAPRSSSPARLPENVPSACWSGSTPPGRCSGRTGNNPSALPPRTSRRGQVGVRLTDDGGIPRHLHWSRTRAHRWTRFLWAFKPFAKNGSIASTPRRRSPSRRCPSPISRAA
jgi:hypothetical protein